MTVSRHVHIAHSPLATAKPTCRNPKPGIVRPIDGPATLLGNRPAALTTAICHADT